MAHIDYYFATISPYTYLAGMRLEEIAQKHGATIKYKPVDAIALFLRTGGQAPKDRHPSRQEYRLIEIERQSANTGLPLNLHPAHWPTNLAPSSYAVIAAQNAGGGDLGGLAHAFTRACWAEERDVSEDAVIRELLQANGFDPELANSGLLTGAETYAQNLEDAVADGAFGVPFYICEGQRFWGQDRLDDLDRFLAK